MSACIQGIALPISFLYDYRGRKYGETQLYFSFVELGLEQVDLLEPGRKYTKETKQLLQYGVQGAFDCLIPMPIEEIPSYSQSGGMRYGVELVNDNPTTACLNNKIDLLPCKQNNLEYLLELHQYLPFYLSQVEGRFSLHIKDASGGYIDVPSQEYSPQCYHGFAHPTITLETGGAVRPVHQYADLDWAEILAMLFESEKKALSHQG